MMPSHGVHAKQHDNTSSYVLQNGVPLAASSSAQDSRRAAMKDSRGNQHHRSRHEGYEATNADCCASTEYRQPRSSSPERIRQSPPKSANHFTTSDFSEDAVYTYHERRHGDIPCSIVENHLENTTNRTPRQHPSLHSLRQAQYYDSQLPLAGHRQEQEPDGDTSSSVYSMDELPEVLVNPLNINKVSEDTACSHQSAQLHEHARWSMVTPKSMSSPSDQSGNKEWHSPAAAPQAGFSSLAGFSGVPKPVAAQKGRKVLFGENGWLERTGDSGKNRSPPKKSGIMGALKRMAKEAADIKVARRSKDDKKTGPKSRMRTSLKPREQSLVYSELEFLLTSALDEYITSQFSAGRLEADKFKKVADMWYNKGRPRIVGFRYDLETQLHLVRLHLEEFRFYGDRAGVPVAVAGILDMMKVNARAMRIRTYCQPDPVIAKQLLDSQMLFNILGCSESCQIQLAEVAQFFKIVLERENRAFTGQNTPST